MLNLVQAMGYLGQDPELRYTQTGQACVNLSVATTETWVDNNNQKQNHTEWHKVVVWGKQAENCAKYLTKGRLVHVMGKLRTRSWVDSAGLTKYITVIVAKEVTFLSSGNNNQGAGNYEQRQAKPQTQAPNQSKNNYHDSMPDQSLPPSLDDIPF